MAFQDAFWGGGGLVKYTLDLCDIFLQLYVHQQVSQNKMLIFLKKLRS